VSISIPGRVVVFDYGEVISMSPSESDRAALVAIAGAPPVAFWATYWKYREGLDQGTVSTAAYWGLVASDLGLTWSASLVHALWAADFRSWISVEPGTIDVIEELPFRHSPMAQFFERMFVSAEMNAIKPDPAIYREVASDLGITLENMVFVDNKGINTDAAAAIGATVHHFVGVAGLRAFLEALAI
jgi:putative hydrolase of the HAD superfamily